MEVIFPWERDDIVVRSTAEDSTDEDTGDAAFATMLTSMAVEADTDARIRTLAEGVRSIASSSEMTTDEVLARVEAALDAGGSDDAE